MSRLHKLWQRVRGKPTKTPHVEEIENLLVDFMLTLTEKLHLDSQQIVIAMQERINAKEVINPVDEDIENVVNAFGVLK
tara:strand:- start:52 stop:288 length:237 start_codon:yes stop_codon:yes gene_type:complete